MDGPTMFLCCICLLHLISYEFGELDTQRPAHGNDCAPRSLAPHIPSFNVVEKSGHADLDIAMIRIDRPASEGGVVAEQRVPNVQYPPCRFDGSTSCYDFDCVEVHIAHSKAQLAPTFQSYPAVSLIVFAKTLAV